MSLEQIIKDHIKQRNHLTMAKYMELCLAHPELGYYNRKDPFGVKGDFITAPEVSQMFGEMLAMWCIEAWKKAGEPQNIAVVEIGPGRGTLMQDFLRATKKITDKNGKGFHEIISVHMIEMSHVLKKIQQEKLQNEKVQIQWHDRLETVPEQTVLLIANELFDALPVHQFVKTEDGWREKTIINDDGKLAFKIQDEQGFNDELVPKNLDDLPVGSIYESSPQSVLIMGEIARRIKNHGIGAVIIDYGYNENAFKETVQAVKSHKYHAVLETPGEADITAHVNFAILKKVAEKFSVKCSDILTQGYFLTSLGIKLRANLLAQQTPAHEKTINAALKRLISSEEMGSLFKVLTITRD